MRSITSYRCPDCGQTFTSLEDFGKHTRENHPEKIPEGWSDARYFYYVLTGNSTGKCRICKGPTQWNEATAKYATLCKKESCQKKYREQFLKNMENRHIGREFITEDHEHIEKMLAGRVDTKSYLCRDQKTRIPCTGDIEYYFMQMMDTFLCWPLSDIMAPSPHMYIYYYDNPNEPNASGNHFYTPDFYIPSLNLEIEIKTSRNVTKKIIAIDDVKEICKDEAMRRNNRVNYIKIYERDYTIFFAFLDMVRQMSEEEFKKKHYCFIPVKPNYYNYPDFDKQMALAKSATLEAFATEFEDHKSENTLAAYGYEDPDEDPDNDTEGFSEDEIEDLSLDKIAAIYGDLAKESADFNLASSQVIVVDTLPEDPIIGAIYYPQRGENAHHMHIMLQPGGDWDIISEDQNDQFEMPAEEAYVPTNEERNIPVYMILTIGNSALSPIIRGATGQKHSHASISFKNTLDPMYSFGTKKIDGSKRDMGFVITKPADELWGEEPTPYDIYGTMVTKSEYDRMMKTLNYFILKGDAFKYHWFGLIENFLNIKSMSKRKFICSQFVALLLGEAIPLNRNPSVYTPTDLGDLRQMEFLKAGKDIRDFSNNDAREIENELDRLMSITSYAVESDLEIPAMESLIALEDFGIDSTSETGTDKVSKANKKLAMNGASWKDRLFMNRFVGKLGSKVFASVKVENGIITIKGINANLLMVRIRDYYGERSLTSLFNKEYNKKSLKLYNKKKIDRGDMKIEYVSAPEFFALEFIQLFNDLADRYKDNSYRRIAELLYENTWVSAADKLDPEPLDTSRLKNLDRYTLKDYQVEFIKLWPKLKAKLNMNGYILAFVQGLGKTLTAVGLSECLNASKVYIVCPKTLTDNWALEIRKYYSKYFNDEKRWRKDVAILGTNFGDPKTAKYLIVNNESIQKLTAVATYDPNAMIILDESHNFRNFNGTRSDSLFELGKKVGSENVLIMSGTPIKATPSEIGPALFMIDPLFTQEAAQMYVKAFNINSTYALRITDARFGKIMYRKEKDVLVTVNEDGNVQSGLPAKRSHTLEFPVKNPDKYLMSTVHDEIVSRFKKYYKEALDSIKPMQREFEDIVRKYSTAPRAETERYLDLVIAVNTEATTRLHEIDQNFVSAFVDTYITPNCNDVTSKRAKELEAKYVHLKNSIMGKAVGEVLPPRRTELFISLYDENRDTIVEMIRNRSKKTIIFSQVKPVITHIAKDLNDFGINTVSITGDTKDRMDVMLKFKEDPATLVLCATSQTLGTGVTLTEASQMFFFGTPWRSGDYEQCTDRIHRIGQTDDVDIYSVLMKSPELNISTRMQSILNWSADMFGAAIKETKIEEEM